MFSAMKNVVIVVVVFPKSQRESIEVNIWKPQRSIGGNEKLEQQENNDKQQTKEEERGRIPSEKTMKRKKNKYRILE